jgi:rhamnosyltransferase
VPAIPDVSIVILTRNAGPRLDRLLDMIAIQQGGATREIVAVDSQSGDGTPERLRARGAMVISIPVEAFDHGETRNVALSAACAPLAVLIVQDAVPCSDRWLDALLKPLGDDEQVAGSFARQRPWPDASRITSHYLAHWRASSPEPRRVGPVSRDAYDRMSPAERHDLCTFDNVCACIRRSVWERHPFTRTPIAEDLEWARDVLLDGHAIVFAPDAAVWHSHDRSVAYELQRTYLVHKRLHALFGLSTVPSAGALLRAVAVSLPSHVRLAAAEDREKLRRAVRAAGLALAFPLGQYLGAKSDRDGRELLRTRGV